MAAKCVPLLIQNLHHENESVRDESTRMLGAFGTNAASALQPLMSLEMTDGSSHVRAAAKEAIAEIKPGKS